MKTKQLMLGMMACVALLATSCDKDDENNGASGNKLPKTTIRLWYENGKCTSGNKTEYFYTGDKLVRSRKAYVDSTGAEYTSNHSDYYVSNMEYTYGADGKLSGKFLVDDEGDTTSYKVAYLSETQVQLAYEYRYGSEGYVDTNLYEMNSQGQVVKGGSTIDGSAYLYTYATDGTPTMEVNSNSQTKEEYEYDGKNGIFKNLNMPEWFFFAEYIHTNKLQNKTSRKSTYGTSYNSTTNYEMEYDADDYPVKITDKSEDSSSYGITTIEYQ